MAPYASQVGVRRFGLLASVLFPGGYFVLPALAVDANSWTAYATSQIVLGGAGFYCAYPQIPPLLTARWFPDRKGLAVSLYFCSFGSGLLIATPLAERLLAAFRVAPPRLSGLDAESLSAVSTGPQGERLLELDGVKRVVVLATERDLWTSGFTGLEEGIFLLDESCSNGVVPTMLAMGVLNFGLLQMAAWSFRLPPKQATEATEPVTEPVESPPAPAPAAPPSADSPAYAMSESLTLAQAQRTPHMYLLGCSTFGICLAGLPFMSVGKLMVQDIFCATALPGAAVAAAVAGYPALAGASSMGGRLLWGPLSDATGCAAALALMGASVPCLLTLPYATGTLTAAGTDPHTTLQLFRVAAGSHLLIANGAPVLLAPVVTDLYGTRHATAIYQRLASLVLVSSPIGAKLVTTVRDRSYLSSCEHLASLCDESSFVEAFGEPAANLPSLVKSHTVTLPLLLHIAPPGTPDPTPLMYDGAFHALAASSAIACVCNIAVYRLPHPRAGALVGPETVRRN